MGLSNKIENPIGKNMQLSCGEGKRCAYLNYKRSESPKVCEAVPMLGDLLGC